MREFFRRFLAAGFVLTTALAVELTAAAPPEGRIAYWPLDETSNKTAADLAGGDNTGTLAGSPSAAHVSGLIGRGALEFTAPHQEITGSDVGLPTGASPGSISVWFNRPPGVGNKVLFCYGTTVVGQARGLWLVDRDSLCFYFYGDPDDLHADVPGGVTPDAWHQVVATYDGTTAKLYYDGTFLKEVKKRLNTVSNGRFQIGTNLAEHSRDFIGQIDEVAVYDRALTPDEIRAQHAKHAATIERLAAEAREQRTERIRALAAGDIVFAVRQPGKDGHWYANFGYWVTDPDRKLYGEGGQLCRMNLESGEVRVLLEDDKGGVRDPQVHYDGRKILFSYRRGGEDHYHLYEIDADGADLRQLTDGPFDDFEPTYLPDGHIVFCSSRCKRWVPCWSTQVAVLYRCDADGGRVRPVSSNVEQENTPCVLPDGRLLYTRWEYLDRSQVDYHHLWTVNPDGTGQMIYYGNQHPGTVMIDAMPIPGTKQIVASFSPGHGRTEHMGTITVVDPSNGPDAEPSVRRISGGGDFRDPYPLAEDAFLVARGSSILLMDGRGETTELYSLPALDQAAGLWCHEPRPLRPRPRERQIPKRIHPERTTGRLVLANVNYGRNMTGVEPGDIEKLLVLESLPEPANFNGAYPYEVSWMEPISFGGTFTLTRALGTVPVEADGSANFELPALRSLFFVALDENDLSVKRMQSFVTVQPGETTSCSGCHEQRTNTPPPAGALAAMQRAPSRIEPFDDVPGVLDFSRDVQPILDRHCVECHNTRRRDGGVNLAGDHTPCYSTSYWTIIKRRLIVDGRNRAGNRPPRTIGSSASRLVTLCDEGHYDVKLTEQERDTLILWIETGAVYSGTYAAYFSGMVDVKFPVDAMTRRCGACHAVQPGRHRQLAWEGYDTRPWTRLPLEFADHGPASSVCNLTRPEDSLLLLAPLAKESGGYGVCRPKSDADGPAPFAATDDADYQAILAAVTDAKHRLETAGRFDMPGYRPNQHYIREMKRFGILPADHDPSTPLDPFATDEAYWQSMWYRPAGE